MMRSSTTIILYFSLAGHVAAAAILATDHAVFAPKKGLDKPDPPKSSVILESFEFWPPEKNTKKMPTTPAPKSYVPKPGRKQKGPAKKTPAHKGPFTMNDLQDLCTRIVHQILSDRKITAASWRSVVDKVQSQSQWLASLTAGNATTFALFIGLIVKLFGPKGVDAFIRLQTVGTQNFWCTILRRDPVSLPSSVSGGRTRTTSVDTEAGGSSLPPDHGTTSPSVNGSSLPAALARVTESTPLPVVQEPSVNATLSSLRTSPEDPLSQPGNQPLGPEWQKLAPRSRMASMAEYSEEMELGALRTPSRATTGPSSPLRISPVDHQRLAAALERHAQVDSGMASHWSAVLLSSLQEESAKIERYPAPADVYPAYF